MAILSGSRHGTWAFCRSAAINGRADYRPARVARYECRPVQWQHAVVLVDEAVERRQTSLVYRECVCSEGRQPIGATDVDGA